jgi:hypothetical protein
MACSRQVFQKSKRALYSSTCDGIVVQFFTKHQLLFQRSLKTVLVVQHMRALNINVSDRHHEPHPAKIAPVALLYHI